MVPGTLDVAGDATFGSDVDISGSLDVSSDAIFRSDVYVYGNLYGGITGELRMWAGATSPFGWLLCDGAAISRTTYSRIFSVIGTTYGIGDGLTTFNIPDFRSRSAIGTGQGAGLSNRVLGATGGAETHVLSSAEMPSHAHSITDPGHTHTATVTDPGHTHTANVTDPGHTHNNYLTDDGHTHTQETTNDDYNNSGTNPPGFSADSAGTKVWENISTSMTGVTITNVSNTTGISVTNTPSTTGTTITNASAFTGIIATNSTGGGDPHNNMHPFLSVNFIIKT